MIACRLRGFHSGDVTLPETSKIVLVGRNLYLDELHTSVLTHCDHYWMLGDRAFVTVAFEGATHITFVFATGVNSVPISSVPWLANGVLHTEARAVAVLHDHDTAWRGTMQGDPVYEKIEFHSE